MKERKTEHAISTVISQSRGSSGAFMTVGMHRIQISHIQDNAIKFPSISWYQLGSATLQRTYLFIPKIRYHHLPLLAETTQSNFGVSNLFLQ